MDDNHRMGDFFLGAFFGGSVAALTALLFTTKTGKQIQNKVLEKYKELESDVKDLYEESVDKIEDTTKNAASKLATSVKK